MKALLANGVARLLIIALLSTAGCRSTAPQGLEEKTSIPGGGPPREPQVVPVQGEVGSFEEVLAVLDRPGNVPGLGCLSFQNDQTIAIAHIKRGAAQPDTTIVRLLRSALARIPGAEPVEKVVSSAEIRVVESKYSFTELDAWRNVIRRYFGMPGGMVMLGINHTQCKYFIGVEDLSTADVLRNELGKEGVPEDAYFIEQQDPVIH